MKIYKKGSTYIRYFAILLFLWIVGTGIIYYAERGGHTGEYEYLLSVIEKEGMRKMEEPAQRLIKILCHAQKNLTEKDMDALDFSVDPYENFEQFMTHLKTDVGQSPEKILEILKREKVREVVKKYPIRWTLKESFLCTNLYFTTRSALFVPSKGISKVVSGIIIIINYAILLFLLYQFIFFFIHIINRLFTRLSNKFEFISSFNRFIGHQITQFQLDNLGKLFLILFILWQAGGLILWLFEREETFAYPETSYINNFPEALWSISVYLLSGYEQYIPQSNISKVISIAIILIGVSIISIFTANIVTIISKRVQEKDNFPEKPSFIDFAEHIVICGVSDKTSRIIKQLHSEMLSKTEKMRQIIVLGETVELLKRTDEDCFKQVWIIKGSPLNNEDLQKANISAANSIIVLSDVYTAKEDLISERKFSTLNISGESDLDKILDARTILCVLAIASVLEKNSHKVHICVELRDLQNKIHFSRIPNKEIICPKEFSQKLLVQSTITFGVSYIYTDEFLIATEATTEIYSVPIPKDFIGKRYWQLEKCLTENFYPEYYKSEIFDSRDAPRVIPVGFITKGYEAGEIKEIICTNPQKSLSGEYYPRKIRRSQKEAEYIILDKNYKFLNKDKLLVISYVPPELKSLKDITKISENERVPEEFVHYEIRELEEILYHNGFTLTKFEDNQYISVIGYKQLQWSKLKIPEKLGWGGEENLPVRKEKYISTCTKCGLGLNEHIVICNWNNQASQIIHQLTEINPHRPIVVVLSDTEILPHRIRESYKNLLILIGESSDYRTLIRAEVETAKAVIILSEDTEDELADTISILTALMIENINPQTHTCVELKRAKNKKHFGRTKVDEIVCIDELTEKLLAQASITPGITEFYLDLLTSESTSNEIYKMDAPSRFIGKTYQEFNRRLFNFHEENILLIGIDTEFFEKDKVNRKIKILPEDENIILKSTDKLFVIAYRNPSEYVHFLQ